MKTTLVPLARRLLGLAVCLSLSFALLPSAFAELPPSDPEPAPPAATTTDGAVQVITTGPAATLTPLDTSAPNSAVLAGSVLTITWNDDGEGGQSKTDNDMKTALDLAEGLPSDWSHLTEVKLIGSAESITKYNWGYLCAQLPVWWQGDPEPETPDVDLSDMKNLREISGSNGSESRFGRSVTLPDTLTTIGAHAFDGWKGLQTINLPRDLKVIGDFAFVACGLDSLSLSDLENLESIGNFAFYAFRPREDFTFSNCLKLTSIGNQAFANSGLGQKNGQSTNAKLSGFPELETIGAQAFEFCMFSSFAFSGCPKLNAIGDSAFNNDQFLENVDLSGCASLETIGANAFNDCSELNSVNASRCPRLTSIGTNAFRNCSEVTAVDFSDCPSLTTMAGALRGQTKLKTVNLSGDASLRDIAGAFDGCTDLESVNCTGCESLTSLHKALQGHENLKTIQFADCANVTELQEEEFAGCEGLNAISLPESVTTIGKNAFQGCTSLHTVTFASGTTPSSVSVIGEGAFAGCRGLNAISLPESVTTIGKNAFQGCTSLCAVAFSSGTTPSGVTVIGEGAFADCENLQYTAHNPGAFASATPFAIPAGVETIEANAFKNCAKLPDITFPKSLASIGANAFSGCTDLRNVYFTGDAPSPVISADRAFDVSGAASETATLLYYPMQRAAGYGAWWGNTPAGRQIPYDETNSPKLNANWSKSGKNGNPPAYEVWDTIRFQIVPASAAPPQIGDYNIFPPTGWTLWPIAAQTTAAAVGAPFPVGGPYAGVLYPSRDRAYGMCNLEIEGGLVIYVGPGYGANDRRPFPLFGSSFRTPVELLPPPVPAEASWLLTVQNGAGGGYYEAEHTAPVVARLKAEPPAPGAKFLRWELVAGTGSFADASAPETRFTMAVGDSTVKAVYDEPPSVQPPPTRSPTTGDSGSSEAAGAALLLLAGGAALILRRRFKNGE